MIRCRLYRRTSSIVSSGAGSTSGGRDTTTSPRTTESEPVRYNALPVGHVPQPPEPVAGGLRIRNRRTRRVLCGRSDDSRRCSVTVPDARPRGARLPRQARRAQLLDAALEVFVAQGFHAAAMDDIAER